MCSEDWPDPRSLSSFQTFPRASKTTSTNGYMDMNGVKSSLSREYNLIPGDKKQLHVSSPSYEKDECFDFEVQFLEVKIEMDYVDRRFGFSVIGGSDEGFSPCIDEISDGEVFFFL